MTMKKAAGFSIFELLIVIAIIAVVSAIVTPNIISWRNSAKLRGAAGNVKGGKFSFQKPLKVQEALWCATVQTNGDIFLFFCHII